MDGAGSIALVGFAALGIFMMVRFVRSLGDVHALARGGHLHRLRAMLEGDPSAAKAKDAKGETPLHHAARHGDLEVLKLLLAHGADPNARTPVGATPLHVARAFGEERAAKLLVTAGAKSEAPGDLSADDPEVQRATNLARSRLDALRELFAEHGDGTQVRVDDEWRKVDDLEKDVAVLTDWKVELPDGKNRGGFTYAVIFARAKKDLGALPPALAEEEERYVDHVTG
jgi:hypothetical protein